MIRTAIGTALVGLALSGPADAVNGLARIRGTVEMRADDTLVVRRYDGGTVTAYMNPKTRLLIATRSRIRDIKPESYISVISEPKGEGRAAREVALYAPSERGFEAGSQPWDTGPGATLTGGWIADRTGSDPVHVRLRHGEDTPSFTLPRDTPTTQIGPGERALLVPGANVVVFARTDAKGLLNADTIAVGRLGVRPAL
ncbi:hypothetical protein [Methylobacterium dankookense]|uniref:DUF5666 domain-containing protein n=1 Tax=Methylobacterium dankookense TaxID=560405 RepID=A0A564FZD8_9HYPH|nr:hypothetical protein [Methylobacterium dankookense]GJD58878.1 hypothetical protein IFDJLNFL_4804 [Methylobacterium dankookense]VUF13337.1 hypothetical protein MTDSW087_03039 [Methylobacterium dankookense]